MVQPLCRQLCAISLRQYTHPLFLQQMKGRVSEEDSLLAPFHISDRNVPSNVGQPKRIDHLTLLSPKQTHLSTTNQPEECPVK